MKRSVSVLSLVVAMAVAAGAVGAQAKPNFTGKWTLVPDPNAPGGGRGGLSGFGQNPVITHNDKTLTVLGATPVGEQKAVYNLDGSESRNPITVAENTVDRVSRVKWDGARLIITTKLEFQGNAFDSTQTWSLSSAGELIVETLTNFQGNPITSKLTFKKG